MAIKTEFTLNITKFKNDNQSGQNTQRTWTRYGYMNPSSPYYDITTFRPHSPFISDNDLQELDSGLSLGSQTEYNRFFPTSDYDIPLGTHAVSALFLEKEADNEILPTAPLKPNGARGYYHGSGKVYRAEAGQTLPANPEPVIRNGARIVFQVDSDNATDNGSSEITLMEVSG